MSSLFQKIQSIWVQEVWAHQYHGIVYGSLWRLNAHNVKILSKSSQEARDLQQYGQPKSKNTDK